MKIEEMQFVVKDLRDKLGLSQRRFGEKYGIPERTVSNWELRLTEPPEYVVELLAMVVGMEDLSLNTYLFYEYRDSAGIGSTKMFPNKKSAAAYAEEQWERMSEADKNTYRNDENGFYGVFYCPVIWNAENVCFEPIMDDGQMVVDLLN